MVVLTPRQNRQAERHLLIDNIEWSGLPGLMILDPTRLLFGHRQRNCVYIHEPVDVLNF